MIIHNKAFKEKKLAFLGESGERVAYSEIYDFAEILNNVLPQRSLIFIFCDNDIETLKFYYSTIICKAVPLLLSQELDNNLVYALLDRYQPQFIWIQKEKARFYPDATVLFIKGKWALLKTRFPQYELHENLALLLMTSGSTGSPNLVRVSFDNLYSCSYMLLDLFGLNSYDRGITTLPMNYGFGLMYLHMHWEIGATVLVTKHDVLSSDFWSFFYNGQVTSLAGVPYTFAMLEKIDFFKQNYSKLRILIESGGHMPFTLQQQYGKNQEKNNYKFYIMYGQTEGLFLTYLPPEMILLKKDSIGIPLSQVNIDVHEGELICHSPTVSMGYASCRQDLCLGDENKGILYTGDMVQIDDDGYIKIVGRKKRFVKISGIRISLDHIEELLQSRFPRADIACVGNDSKIVVFYADSIMGCEIINYIMETIHIKEWFINSFQVSAIPRNKAGKIDYSTLEEIMMIE